MDSEPIRGVSYYRIKMVGMNGTASYSPKKLLHTKSGFLSDVSLYPNPAPSGKDIFLEFKSNAAREILVVIQDIMGKLYYSKVVYIDEGTNKVVIQSYDKIMLPGLYFVVASSDNQFMKKKMDCTQS